MQKRILMLGGSHIQVPAIKYAKDQGHYVITCDYLPDNPGHKYADEYHNVSTTDKDGILEVASKTKIDAIISYASDPGAPTQAYVAEKLGLVGNPYESVVLLCTKDKYRNFLKDNGFFAPKSCGFSSYQDASDAMDEFTLPVVLKPVDSSGSKGVSVLKDKDDLLFVYNKALSFSRAKRVIIEEFVESDGYQIAGDGFIVNKELVFRLFENEHYDNMINAFLPMVVGNSIPYANSNEQQAKVHAELQRLITLLNIQHGAMNFDIRLTKNGDVFLMDIGPRNGGGGQEWRIRNSTSINIVMYSINSALGYDCSDLRMESPIGYKATFLLHSRENGILKSIVFSSEIITHIIIKDIWIKPGDKIMKYDGSDKIYGMIYLTFDSQDQMEYYMDNMFDHIVLNTQ